MAHRAIAGAALVSLFLLAAPASARQDAQQFYGQRVEDVRFEVEGRPATASTLSNLLDLVDVKVGQPLTRDAVRESMDHLNGLQRFDDIVPVVEATPTGVAVTFRLKPRYPVNRIDVTGETGVSSGALRDEVRQRFGGGSTIIRADVVKTAVEEFLSDAGYLTPEVSVAPVVEPGADTATLVVTVRAGPVALIGRSEVKGSSLIPPAEVLRRTQTTTGQPYRRREIETRLTELEDDLRTRRYYEAQAALEATPEGDRVDVVITIDEGPQVELRVDPPGALPGREDELIPIKQLRSADLDLLEDAKAAIEHALRREGYANASAPFARDLNAAGSVLQITFRISRGSRFLIDHVEIPPGLHLPASIVQDRLGFKPGESFDQERFEAGLAAVIEAYRRDGYYRAEAKPDRETVTSRGTATETWVVLHPAITEGPRGQVSNISFRFEGGHRLSDAELHPALSSKVNAPYIELDAARDRDTLLTLYRDRGFLSASVGVQPAFSNDGADVGLTFAINEGPQVLIERITVVGNEGVSAAMIERETQLVPGQPLGLAALNNARRRLRELGIFRSVSINPEDRLSGETEAHVVIRVEPAPANTFAFGAGLEGGSRPRTTPEGTVEDVIALAPRGFFEIGRRHLGGRNRAVNLFTRVGARRTQREDPFGVIEDIRFVEYRVTGTYREQHAFRTDTDLLLSLTSEQASRTTYNFWRRAVNAEFLRRLTPRVNVTGRYTLDFTRLFDERIPPEDRPLIDRLLPQVRLSYVSFGGSWDGRDSLIGPTRGTFYGGDTEIAMRAIGSEVGYLKTFFQASNFRRVNGSPRTVLALRGQVGLARGFERTVTIVDEDGNSTSGIVTGTLPISQRFFAGGGTTVRGFQLDRLGIYEPVCTPPGTLSCTVINPATGLSVGGNALVVLNAEVRRIVTKLFNRNFAVVGFVDGGNVFPTVSDLALRRIRGTSGFGMRYDSPLGPIRLDFGFKFDRLFIAGQRESAWEYHLSIGEAF